MSQHKSAPIKDLLKTENDQIQKLHNIVQSAVQEEELIVNRLNHPPAEVLNRGQLISDKVARFGGSWSFIMLFGMVLFIWIAYNVMAPASGIFDPYPFILMNLILSCIAALQAPVIMMSQNRKEEKDRQRAENDYLINLKAELEIRSLHQKVDLIALERFQHLLEIQQQQIEILNGMKARLDKLK